MAGPLRIEFAGALYQVTARGNERRDIFFGNIEAPQGGQADRSPPITDWAVAFRA